MKNQEITLYCKKEGWAVRFENKYEFINTYSYELVSKYVGKQYKELKVTRYSNYNEKLGKYIDYYYNRETIESSYIIRDHNGDPITAKDLGYSYSRKAKKAVINSEYGRAVPGTGIKRKSKTLYQHGMRSAGGALRKCFSVEEETDDGIPIPPVRKKVSVKIKDRVLWDYWDSVNSYVYERNWKKYRKTQRKSDQ